ncbi:hypothetical protein OOK60_11615 [Trichothermofontia sichuanensis B231]|uniref:hypothetical protein n=1 Tax=Trichothermofontia sichuanensis TaxID=3045816 RepID=UPI002245CDDD|nr:hypothetical protein [Trichothermofontia sichuanensis]UZQ53161.1 hypothetical protein OOK60_11615 [Trichothermofontia sichuanensis B231]
MQVTMYYVLRSRRDGRYLVATIPDSENTGDPVPTTQSAFLLLFQEQAEALSYLNAHARDLSSYFGIEGISQPQVKSVLDRMGFSGVGLVRDPLIPQVEFMTIA